MSSKGSGKATTKGSDKSAPKGSEKATTPKGSGKAAPTGIPADQCFDWIISIPDGIRSKQKPVKFPVDMKEVRIKERKRREQVREEAKKLGFDGGKKGDYVVTMTKEGPKLAAAHKSSIWTIAIVAGVFTSALASSFGTFIYFLCYAKPKMPSDFNS